MKLLALAIALAEPDGGRTVFEPPIRVHYTPAVPEGSARQLAVELKRALEEASSQFGSPPASEPVEVELHATTAAYRSASGAAWWHAAVERQGRLHFQSLSTLDEQGIRRQVIRHEAAHLAIRARASLALFRWREEGEAMRFAGERGARTPSDLIPSLEAIEHALARPRVKTETQRAYLSAVSFVRWLSLPIDAPLPLPAEQAYREFRAGFHP